MSTSYNFKDNLTVDNNKYLKWLDKTGTSRANIIALDDNNNVNVESAFGNMNINTNKPDSYTFVNSNNSRGNVLVGTKLGIGFNTTSNMSSALTFVKNSHIGLNTSIGTSDGYLGMSSWAELSNNAGSRVLLYGNDHLTHPGNVHLYTGNVTNGNLNVYTGNDSLKMQILRDGTFSFIPDGVTSRLTINNTMSTFTHDVVISSTTESHNASTGAIQIRGGIGILGNLYVDGTISLNNATGNINFDSTQTSNSYTSGAIFLSGGMGISTTVNSSSVTSGGALSIAGGAAFGKDVYIGGKLTIINTTTATSSQNASFVVYGGIGVNDVILSRSDASQIQIAPKTSGSTTEITFYSLNNFTSSTNTSSSWRIGQNIGAIGPGKFSLTNSNFGNVLTASYDGSINMIGKVTIANTENAINENDGGAFTVSGGAAFKKDVYIGGAITLAGGGTISGGGGSSEFAYLTLTATDNAINLSTGSFFTYGGITIGGEDDAESVTKGGSILTAGGASIGKSLFVGGPIMQIPVGDTASRPNPAKTGYVRYNSTTSQFEGYGPGGAWGSLGGVVDIAQTTKILASANPSTTDGNLYFYTVGSERVRINSVGNMGIGTTSPSYRLDVNGTSNFSDTIYGKASSFALVFGQGCAVQSLGVNNRDAGIYSWGGFGLTVAQGNGYIGIGTITPSNILTVGLGGRLRISNDSNDYTLIGSQDVDGGANTRIVISGNTRPGGGAGNIEYISTNIGNHIWYNTNSATEKMILTSSGNLGIGITPNYRLDVNGNVHINANLYVDGLISGGTDTGSTFAYLTLTSSDDSINLSTGSLVTYGGITVQSPADAQSVTNGGSFLTDGGASVGKRLFVGQDAIIGGNVNIAKAVSILSTVNATGIGTGGSLTVLGGASISKDVYVGGTVTSSSDIRLKKNIEDFNTSTVLDKIDNIRSIKYNYKNDESNTPYVGFIAQDFVEDFPELLRCPEGGYYSLDYQKVSVILMECIKELKTELSNLKEEIKEIKPARKRVLKGKRVIYQDQDDE
jgi:hypothetical protein